MTKLLQCLRDELVRRDYAASTIRSYIQIVEAFHQHTGARLDRITPASSDATTCSSSKSGGLPSGRSSLKFARFFCRNVLKRRDVREDLPYPKQRLRLPVVLSPDEVQRLIASAKNLYHRTLLLTLYGAGLRRSEACQLKVRDIDSQRMVLRIEQGKGGRDREIPLTPTLLAALREYYRWMRPKTYLFPGTHNGWRADAPITTKVIWERCAWPRGRRGSISASRLIRCGIPMRRICWKQVPTCGRFNFYLVMPTCRTRRCISICHVGIFRPHRIRWNNCTPRARGPACVLA